MVGGYPYRWIYMLRERDSPTFRVSFLLSFPSVEGVGVREGSSFWISLLTELRELGTNDYTISLSDTQFSSV